MHIANECLNCGLDCRCVRRDFSEQAWTVLAVWGEVDKAVVDQPICDDCYEELREILIERADEMELALTEPARFAKAVEAEKSAKAKSPGQRSTSSAAQKKKKKTAKMAS